MQWKPHSSPGENHSCQLPVFSSGCILCAHGYGCAPVHTDEHIFELLFFFFFLKANKDMFDAVLCSPMVILGSSLLRHPELPCFFHSSTLCLYQNGCVISFLWRNTEVVSPLSCFLFHFYGMNGNKVEPWSPHTREFPISTSIPGPLFASWWMNPVLLMPVVRSPENRRWLPQCEVLQPPPRWRSSTSTGKEKQLLRRLICETGSWSMRRLHHGLPDYIKCQQHFNTF